MQALQIAWQLSTSAFDAMNHVVKQIAFIQPNSILHNSPAFHFEDCMTDLLGAFAKL